MKKATCILAGVAALRSVLRASLSLAALRPGEAANKAIPASTIAAVRSATSFGIFLSPHSLHHVDYLAGVCVNDGH